jgi:hypothetical protein
MRTIKETLSKLRQWLRFYADRIVTRLRRRCTIGFLDQDQVIGVNDPEIDRIANLPNHIRQKQLEAAV